VAFFLISMRLGRFLIHAEVKKRRPRFSLTMLLVLTMALCIWLASEANVVRRRREFLALNHQGKTYVHPELLRLEQAKLSWLRRLMGDEPQAFVSARGSQRALARELFPEACICNP
jgi:hypothetical protein